MVDAQDRRAVFKVDARTGRLIDLYVPAEREAQPPASSGGGITGSYNILDRDGHFIVPRQREIEVSPTAAAGGVPRRYAWSSDSGCPIGPSAARTTGSPGRR